MGGPTQSQREEAESAKTLRDRGIDSALLDRAVSALLKYHASSKEKGKEKGKEGKSQLLDGGDRPISVQFGLAKPSGRAHATLVRVDIPHPLVRVPRLEGDDKDGGGAESEDYLDDAEICVIVKNDATKETIADLVEKFPSHMGCVKKVLTLQSLRKKYKQYKERRDLAERFDLFLADDRIVPMLGKELGKKFFESKKQPVPIKVTRKEGLPFAVRRCLLATYMSLGKGDCVSLKVGNTGMPPSHLAENIQAALKAVERIPRKWANVKLISVKTPESAALPVYSKTPAELKEIAALAGVDSSPGKRSRDGADDADASGGDAKGGKKKKQKKGKKTKEEWKKGSPLLRAVKKVGEAEKKKKGGEDENEGEEMDVEEAEEGVKGEGGEGKAAVEEEESGDEDREEEEEEEGAVELKGEGEGKTAEEGEAGEDEEDSGDEDSEGGGDAVEEGEKKPAVSSEKFKGAESSPKTKTPQRGGARRSRRQKSAGRGRR